MITVQEMIQKYLKDNELSWAPSTLKSETARLNSLIEVLKTNDPMELYTELNRRNTKPYTRCTTFIRIANMVDFAIGEGLIKGPNKYADFRRKNKRLFRNCYQRKIPDIKYSEAKNLIENLDDSGVKRTALQILETGMRIHETFKVEDGYVVGKGGKQRAIYGNSIKNRESLVQGMQPSYIRCYRHLKKVGLTPHMLRKLCLSRLVEKGANVFELCEVAGWSNLQTAASYIKVDKERIKKLMDEVQKV